MSIAHQEQVGLLSDHHHFSLESHNIDGKAAPPPTIADFRSHKTNLQGLEYNASPTTSQFTNTESGGFSTQGSSLSSQEMMLDVKVADLGAPLTNDTQNTDKMQVEAADRRNASDISTFSNVDQTDEQQPVLNGAGFTASTSPKRSILGSTHKIDTTAGQKRMANGEIKPSSSVSPVNHLGFELSQLSSTSPRRSPQRSPQIGQLTARLRTRLTYAMVKVQNGWESKTINEVETLAARQRSPQIPTTVSNSPTSSPQRKLLASPQRPGRAIMSPNMSLGGKYSPDSTSSSSGASDVGISRSAPSLDPVRPSLAPPVDLGPKNPRRSTQSGFVPPAIDPRPSSNLSDASNSTYPPTITTTPPTIHRAVDQTPSRQHPSTSMEQDAIETLLFMSSPGNTQYRPNSQQETAPAFSRAVSQLKRSTLSIPPPNSSKIPNTDAIPVSPRKKLILDSADLGSDRQIDRILDELPNESREEEEDTSSDDDDMH